MDLWEQLDGPEREAALLAFEGLGASAIAQKLGVSDRDAERLVSRAFQRVGVRSRAELRRLAAAKLWQMMLPRIERFIGRHGHSQIPLDYHDEDGLLGTFVDSLRRARDDPGRAGLEGVDVVAELERLHGWEW